MGDWVITNALGQRWHFFKPPPPFLDEHGTLCVKTYSEFDSREEAEAKLKALPHYDLEVQRA